MTPQNYLISLKYILFYYPLKIMQAVLFCENNKCTKYHNHIYPQPLPPASPRSAFSYPTPS